MALKIDSKANVAEENVTDNSPRALNLCLTTAKRYVRMGTLFEGGINYTFSIEDAEVLLGETMDDDAPIWRMSPKVKGVTKVMEMREVPTVSMVGVVLKAAPMGDDLPDGRTLRVVEIGSPADNAEIAAMLGKDGVEM